MDSIWKYIHHKYSKNTAKWYPIISVYYLTYSCSLRCHFCSDGNGNPYHTIENNNLEKAKLIGLNNYGPQPECDNRCHSACALGFSTLINNTSEGCRKKH